jgi:hypothetical protein
VFVELSLIPTLLLEEDRDGPDRGRWQGVTRADVLAMPSVFT